jgi:hypothetical protein
VVPVGEAITPALVREVIESLPTAEYVRSAAADEWGHVKIANQYETLYRRVVGGETWS